MRGWLPALLVLLLLAGLPASALVPPEGIRLPRGLGIEDAPEPRLIQFAPGSKDIQFVCPANNGDAALLLPSLQVIYTCPERVYDATIGGNSGYLFGNIWLSIKPDDPNQLAFFTLHGSGTTDGPHPYSRGGLTHTTFPSTDMGLSWADTWTDGGWPVATALGEWATGAIDPKGNIALAYSWTVDGDGMGSLLYAYRMPPAAEASEYQPRYHDTGYKVAARDAADRMEKPTLTYVAGRPVASIPLDNKTRGEIGDATTRNEAPGTMVLSWHEYATNESAKAPMSGWIDFAWADPGVDAGYNGDGFGGNATIAKKSEIWKRLAPSQLIGPCRDASDAVAWQGLLYIACQIDQGYDARAGGEVGDIDVWSFDPVTGNTTFVSTTGINGDNPRIAATSDGYFAVATSRVRGPERVELRVVLGWYAANWQGGAREVGTSIHNAMGALPMRSAAITAIELSDDTKTAFVVYKEWNDRSGTTVPTVDPNDPMATRLTDFKKVVFTVDECTAPIAGAEIVIGTSPDVYQMQASESTQNAFDDLQDGLVRARMPNGAEWIFFAIGDYGAAQFGAMVGSSGASDQVCAIALPPPPLPVAAAPLATAVAQGANVYLAATVGVVSLAMVTYLLTVKRKAPAFTTAEDK